MKNIILGNEYYYIKMSDYRLADGEMKVETRINKVIVKAHYEAIDEPHQYSFSIGDGHFHTTEENLFETLEEAKEYAEFLRNKIEVVIVDEILYPQSSNLDFIGPKKQ